MNNPQFTALCLGKESNKFYISIRRILDRYNLIFISEYEIKNAEKLFLLCEEYSVDFVLMPNPYGNEVRLSLYRILRQQNEIKYFASDRGALPDSWFFDPNGFNGDSSSYDVENWDIPLTIEREDRVKEYIQKQCSDSTALENSR